MSKPENPSAFPSQLHDARDAGDYDPQFGMTLRDWFAGQALSGLSAHPAGSAGQWPDLASDAYKAADAMLAQREQSK